MNWLKNSLKKIGNDIHDMICDNNDADAEDYHGLDSGRDTEAEIETAIRFFPDVLTRRKQVWGVDETDGSFIPIHFLVFTRNEDNTRMSNVKAVSFIPLVVRLAIELGLFEEHERGGLYEDYMYFAIFEDLLHTDSIEHNNREHHEPVDDKYLQVLIQLRKMDLFKKEDIQSFHLLEMLFYHDYYFSEKRFLFLVEWDPNSLLHANDDDGFLPLHVAARNASIRGFQIIFEYCIRYFPQKIGINLLFQEDYDIGGNDTPFQYACDEFGHEQVMKVVEDALTIRSTSSSSPSDNTPPPLNIVEALIMASIERSMYEQQINLDCVYFLLRRQPDVLQKLLLSTPPAAIAAAGLNNNNNDDVDIDEGHDVNSNGLATITLHCKKRKR
jgi:hypothetical protein